ncbi:hypothetical protein [Streptomyces sp. NRRL F-2890]|uniref:hypothetical protein n=1 Tax=Streptomyces sp. NRRL F-2890 TaxID=1463845 RepID=UPI0004C9CD23|nr:hypothetical protein [Streptomyces sp. NRRL F-2890]
MSTGVRGRRRPAVPATAVLAILTALTALTTGCGGATMTTNDGHDRHDGQSEHGAHEAAPRDGHGTAPVAEKPVETARQETRALSERLLELAAPADGATVTDPGPGVDMCEEDPERERLFTMYHAWGLHRLPSQELEQAMDRLRQGLPAQGWTVVEDGVLANANRSPHLLLENAALHFAADITLAGRGDSSQLQITLQSACFSTPEGESPRGEF